MSRQGSLSAQSQAGWDTENPDLGKDVPSHGRRDGLEWSLKVTCSSNNLWFCESLSKGLFFMKWTHNLAVFVHVQEPP